MQVSSKLEDKLVYYDSRISFFNLFEQMNKKKLLLLIHPDCCIEVGKEEAIQYITLLKQQAPLFDYVITHMFFTDEYSYGWNDEEIKKVDKELRSTVKSISNIAVKRDGYGCSYGQELPDYLMDNPNTDIYMSGGYEHNCLWISYKRLFEKLDWLLKEQNHSVYYYKPLLFHTKLNVGKGLGGRKEYPPLQHGPDDWEKKNPQYARDFHPDKVTYKDEGE
jgi:hypothetical protein